MWDGSGARLFLVTISIFLWRAKLAFIPVIEISLFLTEISLLLENTDISIVNRDIYIRNRDISINNIYISILY